MSCRAGLCHVTSSRIFSSHVKVPTVAGMLRWGFTAGCVLSSYDRSGPVSSTQGFGSVLTDAAGFTGLDSFRRVLLRRLASTRDKPRHRIARSCPSSSDGGQVSRNGLFRLVQSWLGQSGSVKSRPVIARLPHSRERGCGISGLSGRVAARFVRSDPDRARYPSLRRREGGISRFGESRQVVSQ